MEGGVEVRVEELRRSEAEEKERDQFTKRLEAHCQYLVFEQRSDVIFPDELMNNYKKEKIILLHLNKPLE